MSTASTEVTWQALPYHPVSRTAAITGRSQAHVYTLINSGSLRAVKLAGKTLITTESILDLLGRAKPWKSDLARTAQARRARPARPKTG